MAGFGETSGTYVNCLGNWQSFTGAVNPPGEARPGWKILRVLGNFMQLNDFNYTSTTEVIDELRGSICNKLSSAWKAQEGTPHSYSGSELTRVGTHALYRCDSLIRHAVPLQRTKDNTEHSVGLNESTAHRLGLIDGQKIRVRQSGDWLPMVLDIDNALADNAVRVDIGFEGSEVLGLIHKPIYIEGVSE
jgi:NADH-quinone oxidoreductase subunit G